MGAICMATRIRVELASISPSVTNWTWRRPSEILCHCLREVCLNRASLDYFPVETSLAAFVIVRGWYQDPAYAVQMLSVMVWLLSCLLGLHNCRNLQLSCPALHVSLTEVVSHIPPSRLRQIVESHLLLQKALHGLLYRFGHCAHHPARFVIFGLFVNLCIFFIIIFIFPFLLNIGTCKIAPTVSGSIQHLLKCCFRLSNCRSWLFNIYYMFLVLHNHYLCVLNSLSSHCGLSIRITLDPFLFPFVALKVCFLSFLGRKLLFGL